MVSWSARKKRNVRTSKAATCYRRPGRIPVAKSAEVSPTSSLKPYRAGCYMLQETRKDSCCQVCKGKSNISLKPYRAGCYMLQETRKDSCCQVCRGKSNISLKPYRAGCYMLEETRKDSCCQVCRGKSSISLKPYRAGCYRRPGRIPVAKSAETNNVFCGGRTPLFLRVINSQSAQHSGGLLISKYWESENTTTQYGRRGYGASEGECDVWRVASQPLSQPPPVIPTSPLKLTTPYIHMR
uniref:(California timema) hypothetical protein n=1 Tax=Timema californicum TaxID=61474 RepID=A0A7R9P9C6_TIMCA|nr:unnamed protein product [Timema californicum]